MLKATRRLTSLQGWGTCNRVEERSMGKLVVNLKTANASNFTVPLTIMIRADEVVE